MSDTEKTRVYFECVSCSAGTHLVKFEDGHYELERQWFPLPNGHFPPLKKGDYIGYKLCPSCGKRTLIKSYYEPSIAE